MTLKEWKARIQVGARLRCTFRHYAPVIDEVIQFNRIQTNAAVYSIESTTRELPKEKKQVCWMYFPKASELKHTPNGFELYFPIDEKGPGKLMSRYEWI